MTEKSGIEQSLRELLASSYPRTQMDVHYRGQVVLQVFNQSDAKNWGHDLFLNNEGGIVVNLFFNQKKNNNEGNLARFKSSVFYGNFQLIEMNKGRVQSYYWAISSSIPVNKISEMIERIIIEVYSIEENTYYEIFLRVF
jgi:hypothetical protein